MNYKIIKKSQGFSLIEVLITVIITSVGLLAYAALQMNGLKQTNSALIRSEASILTSDIADRIRANTPGALAGGYNHALVGKTSIDCSSSCPPYDYAIFEVSQWLDLISERLPLGSGTISCSDSDTTDVIPCSRNSVLTLVVSWDDNRDGEKNSLMQVDVRI